MRRWSDAELYRVFHLVLLRPLPFPCPFRPLAARADGWTAAQSLGCRAAARCAVSREPAEMPIGHVRQYYDDILRYN